MVWPRTVVVLTYHGLKPIRNLAVPEPFRRAKGDFEMDMETIQRLGYDIVSFYDLLAQKELERDAVIVTFDDGLISQVDYALPILQAMGIKATFFVTVADLEKTPWSFKPKTLRDLAGTPRISIESHGYEHTNMKELIGAELLKAMRQAREGFWRYGMLPSVLALPYGDVNTVEMQQAAAAVGFKAVRSATAGVLMVGGPTAPNLFDIPSYLMHENSDIEILLSRRSRWPNSTPFSNPQPPNPQPVPRIKKRRA